MPGIAADPLYLSLNLHGKSKQFSGGTYHGEPEYNRGSGTESERYYFTDVSIRENGKKVKQPAPQVTPLPKPTEKER